MAIDDNQFGSMPCKITIDAGYNRRSVHIENISKHKKLYMCFVDLKKALDRVPRNVVQR